MHHKLTTLSLFAGLDEKQIESLLNLIVFQNKRYGPNSLVVSQGEQCNRLMILTDGMVKGEMAGADGRSLKIEDLHAPTVLAPAFIFGRKNHYPVNIITYNEAKFIVIYKTELLKLFQLNNTVLQNFLGMISSRAQFLSEKLRFHSFKSLRSKLAFYLIDEASGRSSFRLSHSQNDLAELFGVARPSVGRAFMQLQNDGIIDVRYKQVQIYDASKLADAYSE
ncbi:MAG: Crp/Fnr family transcriptional regulator [Prolixibacteraceae bacterium]|nr:Crp/Fnr family transcriptional regulator [Prolixibacteraceae bacterium]MBN2649559.1 Crp/Fnr family transcriptional regulator [Prolixibacteraceae bacterium]